MNGSYDNEAYWEGKGCQKNQTWKNQREEVETTLKMNIKEIIISLQLISIEGFDNDVKHNIDLYVDHHVDEDCQIDDDDNHASK